MDLTISPDPAQCATCEIEVIWLPIVQAGFTYCCRGCAAGGPCDCSYDERFSVEMIMPTKKVSVAHLPANPSVLPMTSEAYRHLEEEIDRLGDALRVTSRRSRGEKLY